MKIQFLLLFSLFIFSCNSENPGQKAALAEKQRIDSINAQRQKWNDSIAIRNKQNIFGDESGTHRLNFSSLDVAPFSGNITFTKTYRDTYSVSGRASSGKNTVSVQGEITKVSDRHLNFEGEIKQKINGKTFVRNKKTTFFDEGKGSFYRLQNKVNSEGFVDYIDIYFK